MLLIIRKVVFLVGLTLYFTSAHSQTVTSTRSGVWTDPAIWSGGSVPTSVNATGIVIDHAVEAPALFAASVFNVIVNGSLTLKASSQLTILADAQPFIRDLTVNGTLICEEGALLNGTSISNATFAAGSVYLHQQGPLGFIPYAAWEKSSTFIINGFKDSGYINIAHSDSWKQSFGNVIYDCPQQTIFVVDLNGYLRNIAGDFIIRNTNNKTLRLSTTQSPTVSIGGSLLVEGPSEIWFSTNGTATVVNIQKDLKYSSTSSGPSYLTTRGMISINIGGNFDWNSPGPLRMASSSADSLGMRRAFVNVSGDLSIGTGVVIAPPMGSGSGRIAFNGSGIQLVNTSSTGSSFQGNLDFTIDPTSIVDLGNSALSNTTGSLQVFGTLRVGSSDSQGAIQLTNKGNIQVSGIRRYEQGSTVEYNGVTPQSIGNGHPSDENVNLIVTNPTKTTLLQDVLCRNVTISTGTFSNTTQGLTIYGDLTVDEVASFGVGTLRLQGNNDQTIDLKDHAIDNVSINKSSGSVSLISPMRLQGLLQIESNNTTLRSDGNLTLLSVNDNGTGSARVGPLPSGSVISGDVTVQRYMSAEGRIFRYISSPVGDASVASLMDDFPVTGRFTDPATNVGNSKLPSLYYYDESPGQLSEGWKPYPAAGLAKDSPLVPGKGYCALVRGGKNPVVWDVTGVLNQGDLTLPVDMTNNSQPSNGWNLVGNPYACTIDWDTDGVDGWTKENISPVFCIRDNGVGSRGSVRYWDGDINYSDIPEGQIPAGQSFWVKAIGPDPRLVIREGVKVPYDATFYRQAPSYIPSFVLILRKDSFADKAYYKVRRGAKANYDVWDAVKMDNDNFDISTLSDDSISLAINSRDSLPCGEHHVKVRVKDLKRGSYKIELNTKYDFSSYNYTWIDHFANAETPLHAGKELELEITDDPASSSRERFGIRLNEILPLDTLVPVASAMACAAEEIAVEIKNAQSGILYSVWENGRQLTSESLGLANDLRIEINADSLSAGIHRFEVIARSACHRRSLVLHPTVNVQKLELTAEAATVCEGETALLSASCDSQVDNFYWFESETSEDTLAVGNLMKTPPLFKSKSYYVMAALNSGCHSRRHRVDVVVTITSPVSISVKDQNVLCSNHVSNNQWIFNGYKIATERELTVEQSGTYVLVVDTIGCAKSDTLEFLYSFVGPDPADIEIFPNPVTDYLTLSPAAEPVDLEIVGGSGYVLRYVVPFQITSMQRLMIDVRELRSGVYFAVFRVGQQKRMVRFVKADK